MILRGGYQAVALKLQEAAELGASDIRSRLSAAIRDTYRGTGTWAYYVDHFGDDTSGDVIYSCEDDIRRSSYTIDSAEGSAAKCSIDFENCECVVPRTVYELEAEEASHYAAMEEALRAQKLYSELPMYERYIAKEERDKADSADFAGKGKSFPILKPSDVMAAVRSIGRAGADNHSADKLKSKIIAVATRKGWTKYLPKGWRPTESQGQKEGAESSGQSAAAGALALKESCAFAADITIREALTSSKKIKLIAPGKGSTAYYTEAALKKAAADKVFRAGTPMRIDHPTAQEESARPEGSVKDWGAVLSRDAEWIGDHPEGPGLYSEIKPFSDHASLISEKAPYAGVSIRANGFAVTEGGKTVMREGVPVLKEFTSAEGVDMVTRAGAGGMFLSEAARPAAIPSEGGDPEMDAAELTKLQESIAAQSALNARLLERAIRGDARELAQSILTPLTLHEAAKAEAVASVLKGSVPAKDGELDREAFTVMVNAEAKRVGELAAALSGSGRVAGMGTTAPVVSDPAVAAREAEARKDSQKIRIAESTKAFKALGMSEEAAKRAAMRDEEAA